MGNLTKKQELFCREYLIDMNATRAAKAAGYSEKTAKVIGAENLTKPDVQGFLKEIMEGRSNAVKIDAEYVLRRLKQIDELDIIDIFTDDMSEFRPLKEWPKEWRTSISGIDLQTIISGGDEPIEKLVKKIKWPDKVKNLEMIGKHVNVKAWDKEIEQSTVVQSIMPVPQADSAEEWERIAKEQQEKMLSHE